MLIFLKKMFKKFNKGDCNMNELKIFENPEFGKVRMMVINNEPYFVGKDVAEMLGYTNTNKALSDHCKGVTKCYIPHPQGQQYTRGEHYPRA